MSKQLNTMNDDTERNNKRTLEGEDITKQMQASKTLNDEPGIYQRLKSSKTFQIILCVIVIASFCVICGFGIWEVVKSFEKKDQETKSPSCETSGRLKHLNVDQSNEIQPNSDNVDGKLNGMHATQRDESKKGAKTKERSKIIQSKDSGNDNAEMRSPQPKHSSGDESKRVQGKSENLEKKTDVMHTTQREKQRKDGNSNDGPTKKTVHSKDDPKTIVSTVQKEEVTEEPAMQIFIQQPNGMHATQREKPKKGTKPKEMVYFEGNLMEYFHVGDDGKSATLMKEEAAEICFAQRIKVGQVTTMTVKITQMEGQTAKLSALLYVSDGNKSLRLDVFIHDLNKDITVTIDANGQITFITTVTMDGIPSTLQGYQGIDSEFQICIVVRRGIKVELVGF